MRLLRRVLDVALKSSVSSTTALTLSRSLFSPFFNSCRLPSLYHPRPSATEPGSLHTLGVLGPSTLPESEPTGTGQWTMRVMANSLAGPRNSPHSASINLHPSIRTSTRPLVMSSMRCKSCTAHSSRRIPHRACESRPLPCIAIALHDPP